MNLPSREECEGWDQAQVAHFLCKNQMQECVVTINKLKINGQKLLCLSDSEISKFSLIHQPQLQKIVQDIKKNEDSLLNKLRSRLKGKPLPKVPARDYRDDHDEQLSDSDYDNDMYEDPREGSYEPPPPHRVFTAAPSTSFSRGEYLDNPINPPQRPPKKPLRPGKASKQLPPEPTRMESDEENYIDPDGHDDDDNYVEPAENHLSNPVIHRRDRAGRGRPMLSTPSPERPPSPDVYEVPDEETHTLSPHATRLCPIPRTSSHSTPPKPSPRLTRRRSPTALQEPTGNDEYEVCDADECSSSVPTEAHPPFPPKPLPRERSPKPPLKPRPDLKPREFESHTLPAVQTDPRPPQKAFTLDLKRPKIPLPQLSSLQLETKNERRSVCDENEPTEQDKDADICNKPWYASTCDRKTADDVLVRANKDGAFLVRKSSGHDAQQPYTLVVFYKGRVYNIPVRFIATTQQYALGREKRGEEYFSSISHIIENHKRTPLVLIDSQSNTKDTTRLWFPVRP